MAFSIKLPSIFYEALVLIISPIFDIENWQMIERRKLYRGHKFPSRKIPILTSKSGSNFHPADHAKQMQKNAVLKAKINK